MQSLLFEGSAWVDEIQIFPRISFTMQAGSWTCMLGPSGVGKTTILRLIAGLESEIVLDGRIELKEGGRLTGQISLMSQTDNLLPWLNATENVVLGNRLRGEKPGRHGFVGPGFAQGPRTFFDSIQRLPCDRVESSCRRWRWM